MAIHREMIARRPLGAAHTQNETRVATIGSIDVYARLGLRDPRSTDSCCLRRDGAGAAA